MKLLSFILIVLAWPSLRLLLAQDAVKPLVSQRNFSEQTSVVHLAPRYATTIKMPEPVSSVVVGDPTKFLAEHSDKEPTLVFVKPVVEERAESNLLVTTTKGRQVSFVLRSEGPGTKTVDFVVAYKPVTTFLVEESDIGIFEVPGTERLSANSAAAKLVPAKTANGAAQQDSLDRLLERQQRASLPPLYGMRPPSPKREGDFVRAGVSEVVDQGRAVVVLFSVVNPQAHAIEILPPQIQLAGKIRTGTIFHHSHWGTSEELPVKEFRLSRRRLGPGERADGVVVFDRPAFKQSNESMFLQIADSGAIDKTALAPIGFGVSAGRKETNRGER
jgi:hypothetical protein